MTARAGRSFSATSSRLPPCAHAGNPPSPQDEVTVVVRDAQRFGVAEARATSTDAPPSDTTIDVVEPIAPHDPSSSGGGGQARAGLRSLGASLAARPPLLGPHVALACGVPTATRED